MLLLHACFFTSAVHAQTDPFPQSLGTVGVHDLKALDPMLTGEGVRFAIVSRAVTYEDGESLNDYRPNLAHRSLSNSDIALRDGVSGPAGISSHSTAVCSILFGQDEAGHNEEVGAFQYQGIAPAAQADVYELWYFMGEVVWQQQAGPLDIISASCGWDFEDWYTRGIEALIECPYLQNVETLNLNQNDIGDEGGVALANATNFPKLTSLSLFGNIIGDEGARAFASSPQSKKYIKLDLYKNQFSNDAIKALTESENLKNCEELEIYRE